MELSEVEAIGRDALERQQAGSEVAADQMGGQLADAGVAGKAEQVADVIHSRRRAVDGDELLQQVLRIAEAADGAAELEAERFLRTERTSAGRCRPGAITASIGMRWKSKRWQREAMVAGTRWISVVARTKRTCGGGS
jgi:hypothetical protein